MRGYPSIILTDETLRDGLQIEDVSISTKQKVVLLDAISDAGIKRIVVGSFVSPKWTPQMADTAEVVSSMTPRPGVTYLAVALNQRGYDQIAANSPPLSQDRQMVQTHQHMCSDFSIRNTNASPDQYEAFWPEIIKKALESGVSEATVGVSAAWGSNWRGEISKEERFEVLHAQWDQWNEAGVKVTGIFLADPMGWCAPHRVEDDIRTIRERWPDIVKFYLHLHNSRGLALVSTYAAIAELDDRYELFLESALGGIGGCPNCGNGRAAGLAPTEDLVAMLEEMGIETGVDQYKLVEAVVMLGDMLGRTLDGKVSKAGPLPRGKYLYSRDIPVIETHEQAQHFRLGPEVYEGQRRPWLKKK